MLPTVLFSHLQCANILGTFYWAILFFLSFFLSDTFTCHIFGATGTPVLDFWCRLLWVSKPESVLPYSHCGGKCNEHFLTSTSGATCCQPLDRWHCMASTGFISCPRILLCGSIESRTRDQQIMSLLWVSKPESVLPYSHCGVHECYALTIRPRVPVVIGPYLMFWGIFRSWAQKKYHHIYIPGIQSKNKLPSYYCLTVFLKM